jgi:hypothetical protein
MRRFWSLLPIMTAALAIMTTTASAVTVVDDTVVTTQMGQSWVTIEPDAGEGIYHVCIPAFLNSDTISEENESLDGNGGMGECYDTFVALNQDAGNTMYQKDGEYRLYLNQSYIGLLPLVATSSSEQALLDLLDERLLAAQAAGVTPDVEALQTEFAGLVELAQEAAKQAKLAAEAAASSASLAGLAAIAANQDAAQADSAATIAETAAETAGEAEVAAVEAATAAETAVSTIVELDSDGNITGLSPELQREIDAAITNVADGESATEVGILQTVASWPLWFWALLVGGLATLVGVIWLLLAKKERKAEVEEEPYAKQSDLEVLNGKVEAEVDKLTALDGKVAQLGPRLDHTEVVAGTALTLASPLRFTDTSDLNSLNTGLTSTWTAVDGKTKLHYVIPFTKNDDGLLEAPILRRADQDDYIQPFKFQSVKKTEERIRLAHADGRLVKCLKNKAAA